MGTFVSSSDRSARGSGPAVSLGEGNRKVSRPGSVFEQDITPQTCTAKKSRFPESYGEDFQGGDATSGS